MKRLNFFPYYEDLLRSRKKTTTFRITRPSIKQGDRVMISIGWNEENATGLHPGLIKDLYIRRICDLDEYDFEGESPDCKSVEAARLVLSCIYRTILKPSDKIWVVKFNHNERKEEI